MLNTLLLWLDNGVTRVVGVVVFTFFYMYVMWAAIKGNLKIGIRFIFISFYTLK